MTSNRRGGDALDALDARNGVSMHWGSRNKGVAM